jgi:hypothetical protein
MEFYRISLTLYKTVQLYAPPHLTLNDMVILPEHPVCIRFIRVSQHAFRISLHSVKNLVYVMEA